MPVTTGDPKNSVITMRPTRAMQRQLADLIAAGYGSQTNVITTAVDRMWRDEYASSNIKLPSLQVWQHRTAGDWYAVRWGVGIEGAFGPLTQDERAELEAMRRAAWQSADVQEGVQAFRERRAPVFEGR